MELDAMVPQLDALVRATEAEAAARRERDRTGARAGAAANAVVDAERLLAALRAEQDTVRLQAADAAAAAAAVAEAERLVRAVLERDRLATEAEAARIAADTAAEAATTAEAASAAADAAVSAAERAHDAARAAGLAMTLSPGAPCPVCGSTNHPSPATPPDGDLPDLAAERAASVAARLRAAARRTQAADRRAALSLADQRLLDARRAAGEETAAASGAALAAATLRHQAAGQAERALAALDRRVPQAAQAMEDAKLGLAGASAEAMVAIAALAEAEGTRRAAAAAVPPDLTEPGALARARGAAARRGADLDEALRAADQAAEAALRAQASAATAATLLEEAERRARADDAEAAASFRAALARAGFADPSGFQDARRDAAAIAALEAAIASYDLAAAQAAGALAEAEAQAKGAARQDGVPLRRALESAVAAARETERQAAEASQSAERLAGLRRKLEELERAIGTAEHVQRRREHLAKVAGGGNAAGISFQRWYLATRLDQALAAANLRLRQMSDHRFALVRMGERIAGNKPAGLDLGVDDAWTGQTRPAASLSGGESFVASLALALGVSDVVQAELGAVRLDTLFIDEGFGSLDPDYLDRAVAALAALQRDGRLVGVISHVDELRRCIPARLEVTPGRDGSRAAFQVS